MENNKNIFLVIKSESEKIAIIINNFLTMLSNRIYIDKNGEKKPLIIKEEAEKNIVDKGDNTYTVKAKNGDHYALKIIFQKISTTGKQSAISEFFKEYAQYKKVIVATDFNNRILKIVSEHYTQMFRESALMTDIISYRDQPKFELLTPKEMEQVKTEYNITDYTTKKILRSDPITKYFALKKGDIIRIIRPSPTSGESVDYRIVM